VVKLRYSLAHIYYTIHHPSLKLIKILSLTVPNVVILSLQKDLMQKRHGLCKNMRGNKRGKCPEPRKRKKRVRREVKWTSVWSRIRGTMMPT